MFNNATKSVWKKRRNLFIFSTVVITIVSLTNYYHIAILMSLGEYLITEQPLEKVDAIVVLGGSVPDRILEAVDIFNQGYAPVILLTKEEQPSGYDELLKLGIKIPEQYEVNKSIALKLGVPATSTEVLDGRANSTYSEMELIYDYLKKRNFRSIIIVTSKSHTTRATKIFNLVKDEQDIKVVTIPSKYDDFDPKGWWKVRRDWKEVIFEYQKLADYYFLTLIDVTTGRRN